MARTIQSLAAVVSDYDAIILDQWGVLHDGSSPYPGAVACLERLQSDGHRLAVLSTSGKRAGLNLARIEEIGFSSRLFAQVMTSGEALWRDTKYGRLKEKVFFPIERKVGDAASWARRLDITLSAQPETADAILLMGLPDGSSASDWQAILEYALANALPVYCSNPDRARPEDVLSKLCARTYAPPPTFMIETWR